MTQSEPGLREKIKAAHGNAMCIRCRISGTECRACVTNIIKPYETSERTRISVIYNFVVERRGLSLVPVNGKKLLLLAGNWIALTSRNDHVVKILR